MPAVPPPAHDRMLFSTRNLLYCAVFAALQTLVYLVVSPFALTFASALPPAYALVAGAYSVMLFTARLFIGRDGAATLTAAVTGALVSAVSPVGFLVFVVLMTTAAVFDLVLYIAGRRSSRIPSRRTILLAATLSAIALFLVSLPVFSAAHLTVGSLTATLVGRVVAQVAAVALALGIVASLTRAGVRGTGGPRSS